MHWKTRTLLCESNILAPLYENIALLIELNCNRFSSNGLCDVKLYFTFWEMYHLFLESNNVEPYMTFFALLKGQRYFCPDKISIPFMHNSFFPSHDLMIPENLSMTSQFVAPYSIEMHETTPKLQQANNKDSRCKWLIWDTIYEFFDMKKQGKLTFGL